MGEICQSTADCMTEKGLFCKENEQGSEVCTMKKKAGEPCEDDRDCLGFCASNIYRNAAENGVCVDERKNGESCQYNYHCNDIDVEYMLKENRESWKVCNNGICEDYVSLLRKPGLKCDSRRDLCDRDRNLKCELLDRKYVCVQRSKKDHECTRGSRFSFCQDDRKGVPLECRKLRTTLSKEEFSARPDTCLEKTVVVRKREICSFSEREVCEESRSCVLAPTVENVLSSVFDYFFSLPAVGYCMKKVSVRGICTDRLETVCEKGTVCIKNVCTVTGQELEVPRTLSGLWEDCGDGPGATTYNNCAPGLKCMKSQCQVPTPKAKRSEPCFETAIMKKVRWFAQGVLMNIFVLWY